MDLISQIKDAKTKRIAAIKGAQDLAIKAKAESRSLNTEENSEIDKRMADATTLADEIARLEKLNEMSRSLEAPVQDNRTAGRQDTGTEKRTLSEREEIRNGLDTFFHTGNANHLSPEARAYNDAESRALASEVGIQGGYLVAPGLMPQLEIALKFFGGIPEACTFWDTPTGGPIGWPTMNDTVNTGRFQGENTPARDDSTSPKASMPGFGLRNFNAYMFDSDIILIPVQLVQDSAINIETTIVEAAGIRIGRILNTLCTTGTGAAQPQGILTATAAVGPDAASHTAIAYADLQNLRFSVDKAYRNQKSAWMMNDQILKQLALLTDTTNRPIFLTGGLIGDISKPTPDTLAGHKIVVNNDMPATLAAGNQSVLFGDFSKYRVRRVGSMAFIRFVERYMNGFQIGYMAYQRFDGSLIDAGTHPVSSLTQ